MSRVKSRYLIVKALLISYAFGIGAVQAAERGELDTWIAANRLGTADAYQSFLDEYPDSAFAEDAFAAPEPSWTSAAGRSGSSPSSARASSWLSISPASRSRMGSTRRVLSRNSVVRPASYAAAISPGSRTAWKAVSRRMFSSACAPGRQSARRRASRDTPGGR